MASAPGQLKSAEHRRTIAEIVASVNPRTLAVRVVPVISSTIAVFGDDVAADLGRTFQLDDPAVRSFLREYAGDRISRKVNATTRRRIKEVIVEGIDQNVGRRGIRRRIERVFAQSRGYRSGMIADTEINRASNFASERALHQAGIRKKEWLSTLDGHTRDTHITLNGQVRGTRQKFQSPSGARGMYPGDFGVAAEDINCRCGVLGVIDEKSLGPEGQILPRHRRAYRSLKRRRAPFLRQYRRQIRAGFAVQATDVLNVFDLVWPEE